MDKHVQGAQMTTPGLDRDYRIRHSIRQAPNKWELYAEKKEHEFFMFERIYFLQFLHHKVVTTNIDLNNKYGSWHIDCSTV